MIIGEWARELGAKVEGRQVSSAKSWLSHQAVDRSSDILPWAGASDVEKVSPVVASASYLTTSAKHGTTVTQATNWKTKMWL
ncbi:chaperone protein DnaK [Vibrio ponticus]|nr:chaperone protein DnaK [Vibrio ponticus]